MKKILYVLTVVFVCFIASNNLYSQPVITVQNGENVRFFNNLQVAIDSAESGSSIYLTGLQGNDYLLNGNISINKKIHLYGTGHYPDSTTATGRFIIGGHLNIQSGSDSGSVYGLTIHGNLYIGGDVNNFYFSRSFVKSTFYLGGSESDTVRNVTISESVFIGYLYAYNVKNIVFKKNIFESTIRDFDNQTAFVNNVFLRNAYSWYGVTYTLIGIEYCLFENNVFLNKSITHPGCLGCFLYDCNYNIFNNNIFNYGVSFPQGTNVGTNNINDQPWDSIFVNQSVDPYHFRFNYGNDYHLKETSPGKNAGTDSTDIGIYGSSSPYKEGAVPPNPHFRKVSIKPDRVSDGILQVEIEVEAQKK